LNTVCKEEKPTVDGQRKGAPVEGAILAAAQANIPKSLGFRKGWGPNSKLNSRLLRKRRTENRQWRDKTAEIGRTHLWAEARGRRTKLAKCAKTGERRRKETFFCEMPNFVGGEGVTRNRDIVGCPKTKGGHIKLLLSGIAKNEEQAN